MYGSSMNILKRGMQYSHNFMLYTVSSICCLTQQVYKICKKYIRSMDTFYKSHFRRCEFVYRNVLITTNNPKIRPIFETVCLAPKFIRWLDDFRLDKFDLRTITLTDVDFFGPTTNPEKLGFLKFTCEVYTMSGEPIDGIVFLRGDCGAVLICVEDENKEKYVLLTEQPRIPTCNYKEEIVAGMFDARRGTMVVNNVLKTEIREETGLELDETSPDFVQLGHFTLSGGGCDENVHLAIWKTNISSQVIEEMKRRQFGAPDTNEKIRLKFYPFNTFESQLPRIADAKTSLAWLLFKDSKYYL